MSRVLPILFNTDMVRAILDGRKTVTRRVIKKTQCNGLVKIPPEELIKDKECLQGPWSSMTDKEFINSLYNGSFRQDDILYIRETWSQDKNGEFVYRTDYGETEDDSFPPSMFMWRPSIHMPKEATRIWLRVKDVRPERVHDMTLDDFLREGVVIRPEAFNDPENAYQQAKSVFVDIWNFTIKKSDKSRYGWDVNPWVWVIEFERCEKPKELCIIR